MRANPGSSPAGASRRPTLAHAKGAGALLAASICLSILGCRQAPEPPPRDPIDEIDVSIQHAGGLLLGIGPDDIGKRAEEALAATDRFERRVSKRKYAAEGWNAKVELLFARALASSAGAPGSADVAARIVLTRASGQKLRAEGRGQSELPPQGKADRDERFRRALDAALAEAAGALSAELNALEQPDERLVEDLTSIDPFRKDLAIRVLADRKSVLAIPGLVELLRDEDRDRQLRAVGALVAIGDRGAAAALVETTTQRDPAFVIQVAYALSELGGMDAEAYLFTASNGHPDAAVRRAATEALRSLVNRKEATPAEAAAAPAGEGIPNED